MSCRACVLPCCPCWRCQGSYRPLWERESDPETSSFCLKKSSSRNLHHFGVMWYMHSISSRRPQHPAAWAAFPGPCAHSSSGSRIWDVVFSSALQSGLLLPRLSVLACCSFHLWGTPCCPCGKWHRGIVCLCVVNPPPAGPVFCSSWYQSSGCSLWIPKFVPKCSTSPWAEGVLLSVLQVTGLPVLKLIFFSSFLC